MAIEAEDFWGWLGAVGKRHRKRLAFISGLVAIPPALVPISEWRDKALEHPRDVAGAMRTVADLLSGVPPHALLAALYLIHAVVLVGLIAWPLSVRGMQANVPRVEAVVGGNGGSRDQVIPALRWWASINGLLKGRLEGKSSAIVEKGSSVGVVVDAEKWPTLCGTPAQRFATAKLQYGSEEDWKRAVAAGNAALHQLKLLWETLLGLWVVMYLVLFVGAAVPSFEWPRVVGDALALTKDVLHLCTTLSLAFIFLALDKPTTKLDLDDSVQRAPVASSTDPFKPWVAVAAVLAILRVFSFVMSQVPIATSAQALLSRAAAVLLETGSFAADVLAFFALVSLVARLESKFLRVPRLVVAVLYVYAGAQLGFHLLDATALRVSTALLTIAVLGKGMLVLVLDWTLSGGRLLYYMLRVRSLQVHGSDDWAAFESQLVPYDGPRGDGPGT